MRVLSWVTDNRPDEEVERMRSAETEALRRMVRLLRVKTERQSAIQMLEAARNGR